MKCKKHPTYKALRKPRVKCVKCWKMYWTEAKNQRRCELIDKSIYDTISLSEEKELNKLQKDAEEYRQCVAPLPIKEAIRIRKQLEKELDDQRKRKNRQD